jgi:hypothetical protein
MTMEIEKAGAVEGLYMLPITMHSTAKVCKRPATLTVWRTRLLIRRVTILLAIYSSI